MELINNLKRWAFTVMARKVIIKGVTFALAWLASGAVQSVLTSYGVAYDPIKLRASLTGLAMMGFKALEDYLNLNYGLNI